MPSTDNPEGIPDGTYAKRLEAAWFGFVDVLNELGDNRIVAISRTHSETAFRIARDFHANPPKIVTAASPGAPLPE